MMGWQVLVAVMAIGFLVAGAMGQAPAPGKVLYVSVDGNDRWSGTRAERSGTDGPFKTLEQAREAVRDLKKAGWPAGGVEVQVRGGTYEVAKTFTLSAEDSGVEGAPAVYRTYPGEKVILTGSRRVTGFAPHQGNILKADVRGQGFTQFRELFMNGQRQVLARYPNFDPANAHGGGFAYVAGKPVNMYTDLPQEELRTIRVRRNEVRKWTNAKGAEVIIFPRYNWINMQVPVASADPEARTIALGKDVSWGFFKGIRPLDRYYVRNLLEELDTPGEWYLDQEAGVLYFWPPVAIETAEVRAPVTPTVLRLEPKAAWITIRGFTIQGCDGTAVEFKGTENCLFAGNTVHDTGSGIGGNAGIVVSGGRNCRIIGNDVYEVANNGIEVRTDAADLDTLTPSGHVIDNNYVHHIGHLNGHGNGIYFWRAVGLKVSNNLVHDTTRCGIYGNGTDCIVEYNHVRHVNLETEDTGGFYTASIAWHVRGMVVRHNYIHDVLGYGRTGDRWHSPHFAWGIYLDDDMSGVHVYGNIVARTTNGGVMIHGGRDNVVENNILIDSTRQQAQFQEGRAKEIIAAHQKEFAQAMEKPAYRQKYPQLAAVDPQSLVPMAGNRFERNIIVYQGDDAKLYLLTMKGPPGTNASDYNVVWHHGKAPVPMLGWDKPQTWEQWQKLGLDTHSAVADPMFVDAEKGDYRLKPESPALKLGFKQIPVEKIGLYASELRATWPVVEAKGVREVGLVEIRVEGEE